MAKPFNLPDRRGRVLFGEDPAEMVIPAGIRAARFAMENCAGPDRTDQETSPTYWYRTGLREGRWQVIRGVGLCALAGLALGLLWRWLA